MVVLVNTDGVDAADREDALRQAMARAAGAHDVRFLGPARSPRALMSLWRLGRDVVAMSEFSTGIEHRRDERHDRVTGPERIAFVVHGGPTGTYSCTEYDQALSPGGLYVTDLSAHFAYRRPGAGEARIVQLERGVLGLSAEKVRSAAPEVVRSPLYPLFRAQLVELVSGAKTISCSPTVSDVADAVIHLASALLRSTAEGEPTTTDFLCERIELYLRTNLHRRDLSPEFVAYAHNISVRYLFKLWSDRPRSLMETVYALRLDHARRLLVTHPSMPIGAVASESGFENASHFSRRFRDAYGTSPREQRQHMRSGDKTVQ